MDPLVKPAEKPDPSKQPLYSSHKTEEELPARERIERALKNGKEPIVTGHETHDELLERALIERPIRSYGHGIPLFPQAMLYVVLIAALAIVLLYLARG
jgi:hypothetical protein